MARSRRTSFAPEPDLAFSKYCAHVCTKFQSLARSHTRIDSTPRRSSMLQAGNMRQPRRLRLTRTRANTTPPESSQKLTEVHSSSAANKSALRHVQDLPCIRVSPDNALKLPPKTLRHIFATLCHLCRKPDQLGCRILRGTRGIDGQTA